MAYCKIIVNYFVIYLLYFRVDSISDEIDNQTLSEEGLGRKSWEGPNVAFCCYIYSI
jgi:hypothetical protein